MKSAVKKSVPMVHKKEWIECLKNDRIKIEDLDVDKCVEGGKMALDKMIK